MSEKNIVLVGFMGSGKSAVSRHLAQIMNRTLVSTDDRIEANQECSISDIFEKSGEAHFRSVEKNVIAEVSALKSVVIDCGGGVVLDPQNMTNLKSGGITVFLRTSPEVIFARIKNSTHRPLLKVPDPKAKIKEILSERNAFYEKADIIIDTDGKDVEKVCNNIFMNISKLI